MPLSRDITVEHGLPIESQNDTIIAPCVEVDDAILAKIPVTLPLHREEPPRDPRRRRDKTQIDILDKFDGDEQLLGRRSATQIDGSCQPCGSDAPFENGC